MAIFISFLKLFYKNDRHDHNLTCMYFCTTCIVQAAQGKLGKSQLDPVKLMTFGVILFMPTAYKRTYFAPLLFICRTKLKHLIIVTYWHYITHLHRDIEEWKIGLYENDLLRTYLHRSILFIEFGINLCIY